MAGCSKALTRLTVNNMADPTFYIVGAYGMTALAVVAELAWLRHHRRKALERARAMAQDELE